MSVFSVALQIALVITGITHEELPALKQDFQYLIFLFCVFYAQTRGIRNVTTSLFLCCPLNLSLFDN